MAALVLSLLSHVALLLATLQSGDGLAPAWREGIDAWLPARPDAAVMRVDFRESRDYLAYDATHSRGQVASEHLPVVARRGPSDAAPAEHQLEPVPATARAARHGGGNDCRVAGFRFCSS